MNSTLPDELGQGALWEDHEFVQPVDHFLPESYHDAAPGHGNEVLRAASLAATGEG